MRVDLNARPELSESDRTSVPKPTVAASHPSSAASVPEQDQTHLSSTHAQVQLLAAEAARLPEVRQQQVSALRLAVQGGSYRPRPQQIASAVISQMLITRTA